MSLKPSALSTTLSVLSAGIYCLCRSKAFPNKTLRRYLPGVLAASIIHGTRPYTEKYLETRMNKRSFNWIYGAFSLFILGASGHLSKVPRKVNILSALILTGAQLASHKLAIYFFPPPEVTAKDLENYRRNTLNGGRYLSNQLFPHFKEAPAHHVKCQALIYVLPEGFQIILARTEDPGYLLNLPTVDGTEAHRLIRMERLTLSLSPDTLQNLITHSRRVHVKPLDGQGEDLTWALNGIPPFISIEGRWNQAPQPHGKTIDWEALITQGKEQKHEAFELHLTKASWEHKEGNPHLRGMSYNHSQIGFKIWVHEQNTQAFDSAKDELEARRVSLKAMVDYVKKFEEHAFTFRTTHDLPRNRNGNPNWKTLGAWTTLTHQIPFFQESNSYQDIPGLVEAYKRNQTPAGENELVNRFEAFFESLPWDIHFGTDHTLHEQFLSARSEFRNARGYLGEKTLKNWCKMLEWTELYMGHTDEITAIKNLIQRYLTLNGKMRCAEDLPPRRLLELKFDRQEIDPQLKEKLRTFFATYQSIERKGIFVIHLQRDVDTVEKKQRRLEVYQFCEAGNLNFNAEGPLLSPDRSIDPQKLEECREAVKLWKHHIDRETYARMQSNDSTPQELIDTFRWFFTDYLTHLPAEDKEMFMEELARFVDCPRSHRETTAQLAYESPLSPSDLNLILRRYRSDQTLVLIRHLESYINRIGEDRDLSEDFFNTFKAFYEKVENFVKDKSIALETKRKHRWENGELVTVLSDAPCDGSEHRFDPCDSRNSRDLLRLLKDVQSTLASLYTSVNQTNREAYCSSNFLEEEVTIMDAFYNVAHSMLRTLNVPCSWDTHTRLHENSRELWAARQALADPARYIVCKRIGTHGGTGIDVIEKGGSSALKRRNEFHNAIYPG